MWRAAKAEWVKVRRPASLAATVGLLAVLALLLTVLVIAVARGGGPAARGSGSVTSSATIATLSAADGFATLFQPSGTLVAPLVTLVLFAVNIGTEYRAGTVRLLLVQQPTRLRLLAGKFATLIALTAAMVLAAAVISGAAGLAIGSARHIAAGHWFGSAGLAASAAAVGEAFGMSVAWGLFGAVAAVATRSSAAAIGIAAGYLLILENVLGTAWDGFTRYFPAHVTSAFGVGGSSSVPFGRAVILTIGYVAAAAAVGATIFARRDVTE